LKKQQTILFSTIFLDTRQELEKIGPFLKSISMDHPGDLELLTLINNFSALTDNFFTNLGNYLLPNFKIYLSLIFGWDFCRAWQ